MVVKSKTLDSLEAAMFGTDLPIIQAPMAGANGSEMVIAVCEAGGLGSLPCAMLSAEQVRTELTAIQHGTSKPVNINFFCHTQPEFSAERAGVWSAALDGYYQEYGIDSSSSVGSAGREPFNSDMCDIVEEFKPAVVSFHFGLPDSLLLHRVRQAGCKVISTATTVEEACWLEQQGCDAVIAQGMEAGGHRGMFLASDVNSQLGLISLLPQIVDAVQLPVIAAGGIADGRGITAAFALGASAVQIGTAYLSCSESLISSLHRAALQELPAKNHTALTNVFSGRPARGVINRLMSEMGCLTDKAPEFPLAGAALAPLKAAAEAEGAADFSPLWSGQSGGLNRRTDAGQLTRLLAEEAKTCLDDLVV